MMPTWPAAAGVPVAAARLRATPEDFVVEEVPGFHPEGEGEHVFLHLEKRELTTPEVAEQLSRLAGVHPREIGYSGMKDRNALTRQWFSVGMGGRPEPDWNDLQGTPGIRVLEVTRHRRKLRRGVHRGNRFALRLREVAGDRDRIEERLARIRAQGVPNYFGEQRFGREGATLQQARRWMEGGGGRISRNRRSVYLSALRSLLFNQLLALRVAAGDWDRLRDGDVCVLAGTRSLFAAPEASEDLVARCAAHDLHPALPLWGRGRDSLAAVAERFRASLAGEERACAFLERMGLELDWRPARLLAGDFCWQFCDDDSLLLTFELGAGGFATALLAEFVRTSAPGSDRQETLGHSEWFGE